MSRWPDPGALELLVAVAEHGSLAAGARAVGMAQPNASRSISRLERHLRVPLLQRSTAGSRLTPAGVVAVEWARDAVTALQRLTDGAAGLVGDDEGELRVSASQTVAEHLLPVWLARFRVQHPAARVSVRVSNTGAVVDGLRQGDADLGFVEGPRAPTGLRSVVVARDELLLVCAQDHPWARRQDAVTPAELATTPLVTREPGSGTRVALEEAIGSLATPALELASNASVRLSVVTGAAPGVLSRLAVADALDVGSLVVVPIDGVDLRRDLRGVWNGPRRPSGHVAELLAAAVAVTDAASPTPGSSR